VLLGSEYMFNIEKRMDTKESVKIGYLKGDNQKRYLRYDKS